MWRVTLIKSLTGADNLAMNGLGTTVLAASNTYTGTTTISAGTLQLGTGTAGYDGSLSTSGISNNAALVYNLSGSQTAEYRNINGTMTGAGSMTLTGNLGGSSSLTKAGNGVLILAGANNNYTGTTSVNGGTLAISGN